MDYYLGYDGPQPAPGIPSTLESCSSCGTGIWVSTAGYEAASKMMGRNLPKVCMSCVAKIAAKMRDN